MKLRVVWRKHHGLMQRSDGVGPFLLRNLDVRAELQRFHGGPAGFGAIQFGEGSVILTLIHKETDIASMRSGIIGFELEILAISRDRFGLFLCFEAFCQATTPVDSIRLNFDSAAESRFGFRRLAGAESHPAQIPERGEVLGVEM